MAFKHDWPSDSKLIELVAEYGKAGTARELDVPVSTLKDRVAKIIDSSFVDELSDSPSEEYVEIPVFFRDYSHLEKLHVYLLGDIHLGSPAHAKDRWLEWIDYLEKTPYASLLGTGDFLNCALKTSKSESYDEVLRVGEAKRLFQTQIKKLASQDRIDILLRGNHELRVYKSTGECPIEDVCFNLEINYSPASALIVYKVGDIEYDVMVRHGTGSSGGMIGSRANQLQRGAHVVSADAYVSGHVHNQLASSDIIFVRNGGKMERKRRVYVASGSFLGYEQYASDRGYIAGKIGAPRLHLNGERRDLHVSI